MNKFIDISGQRFGALLAMTHDGPKAGKETKWRCICDCGNEHFVRSGNLRKGLVLSCGCVKSKKASDRLKTHGMTGTSTYHIWLAMRDRCLNRNNPAYKNYGGRGITVCPRWLNNFENFLADMSERPKGLTLERRNNDKGYSPLNCKWATRTEQTRNTRNTKLTLEKAIAIIHLRWLGVPCQQISNYYGISISHLHAVVRGKVWAEAQILARDAL